MSTKYALTFGNAHRHKIGDKTTNGNTVFVAREKAFSRFGHKWCWLYELENLPEYDWEFIYA